MNAIITREQYIQFSIHTPVNYTGSYLAEHLGSVSHDTVSDFLKKQPIEHTSLWEQNKDLIHDVKESYLIVGDSVQEKPYARAIELIYPHYSGNKHRLVQGIDIFNLVHSSDQQDYYPVDYRIYAPEYQHVKKTKNDYFLEMLQDAFEKRIFKRGIFSLILGIQAFKISTISINRSAYFIPLFIRIV